MPGHAAFEVEVCKSPPTYYMYLVLVGGNMQIVMAGLILLHLHHTSYSNCQSPPLLIYQAQEI
jgi:hypothetical protein